MTINKKYILPTALIIAFVAVVTITAGITNKTEPVNLRVSLPDYRLSDELTTEEETISIPSLGLTNEEIEEHLSDIEESRQAAARAEKNKKTVSSVQNDGNKDNAYYLAAAVCREAGGESAEIQMLVATVVMNRVGSKYFPNTIYGVLTQKHQYGLLWKYGISFPSWADENIKTSCYSIANRVLSGERACPSNVVFQAEFVQGSGIYAKRTGSTGTVFYFCYL